MISPLERLQFWIHKKAPRLLTFLQQFTIMEWIVLILVLIYIMEYSYGLE
jgi:hypothetical protein